MRLVSRRISFEVFMGDARTDPEQDDPPLLALVLSVAQVVPRQAAVQAICKARQGHGQGGESWSPGDFHVSSCHWLGPGRAPLQHRATARRRAQGEWGRCRGKGARGEGGGGVEGLRGPGILGLALGEDVEAGALRGRRGCPCGRQRWGGGAGPSLQETANREANISAGKANRERWVLRWASGLEPCVCFLLRGWSGSGGTAPGTRVLPRI